MDTSHSYERSKNYGVIVNIPGLGRGLLKLSFPAGRWTSSEWRSRVPAFRQAGLPLGMSFIHGAKTKAYRSGATCLKRILTCAEMFRAESKDHEGTLRKEHDRIASRATERGSYHKPRGCGVAGGCRRRS